VRNQDLVIHVAAKVGDWGDYACFHKVNVEGSLALIDAISTETRMIHISSTAVLGEEDFPEPKPVDAPFRPRLDYPFESMLPSGMNHYRISKAIAEKLVVRRARIKGTSLTVLRPVWIYGPREFGAGPYEYCKALADGVPAVLGASPKLFQVIFVQDLARVILRVAEAQKPGIKLYNVGNPDIPSIRKYWGTWCRETGFRGPLYVPQAFLSPLGFAIEAVWTMLGVKTPPLLTRARISMYYNNNIYDVRGIIEDYNLGEFTPLVHGIRKTVRWWKMNGFL